LVQTEGPAPFGLAGAGGPALPSPQPKVRGEKQWQTWAQNLEDWGAQQETVANTRIPYASTLVQLKKNALTADDDDENDPSLSILYQKEKDDGLGDKMSRHMPHNIELAQTRDDDPKKMEGMLMEEVDIPLNMRLLHIETAEGDELIMEKK